MSYDLSNLYKRETVDLGLFQVTVIEVPHGKIIDVQKEFIGKLQMAETKAGIKKNIRAKHLDTTSMNDKKQWLAIESWTLKDANGKDVPVCAEAWLALPHNITEQVEKVIARLNPNMDEAFPDEDGEDTDESGGADSE